MEADVVLGQASFTSVVAGSATRVKFNSAVGVGYDGRRLYLVDGIYNRILVYNSIPTTNSAPADLVIGQSDFVTSTAGTSQTKFTSPQNICFSGGQMFITDTGNSRVLIYNSIPSGNLPAADIVVGQSDFTSFTTGTSRERLSSPSDVLVFDGKLVVSDRANNRVLMWNSIPKTNFAAADLVLGQPDFSTGSSGTSASSLSVPTRLFFDGKWLFVCDSGNSRVLIWKTLPTRNGQPADLVLGQHDFNTSGSADAIDESRLSSPSGVYSNQEQLFVADAILDRILVWKKMPEKNNERADVVLGYADFSPRTQLSISRNTLNGPQTLTVIKGKLVATDNSNRRVLIYNIGEVGKIKLGPQFTQGKALVGKVFEDTNGNGLQDDGEKGMEGVKVASDSGIYAITDSDGKYHFPYIETGQRVLKIDESTLPEGSTITTESPRKIVVTEGILSKVSFGVKLAGESVKEEPTGPLLKVTVSQDPVLLKPKLSIEANQSQDKIIFTIHTNYSLFISKADLILYDKDLKPFKTLPLPGPIPYRHEISLNDLGLERPSVIYYQLRGYDDKGRTDRTGMGALKLA